MLNKLSQLFHLVVCSLLPAQSCALFCPPGWLCTLLYGAWLSVSSKSSSCVLPGCVLSFAQLVVCSLLPTWSCTLFYGAWLSSQLSSTLYALLYGAWLSSQLSSCICSLLWCLAGFTVVQLCNLFHSTWLSFFYSAWLSSAVFTVVEHCSISVLEKGTALYVL